MIYEGASTDACRYSVLVGQRCWRPSLRYDIGRVNVSLTSWGRSCEGLERRQRLVADIFASLRMRMEEEANGREKENGDTNREGE